MLANSPKTSQSNLFFNDFLYQLDEQDPLIQLSFHIDWSFLEKEFASLYSNIGRPAKPIRLMVGLLILKSVENLSDERVVLEWKRNPYYQAFCGIHEFQRSEPCDASELVHFRHRIGVAGVEKIFQASALIHGKKRDENVVNIDTTVQEKNITYPTDGKLAIKIINRLNKLAKRRNIKQRRTYVKEVKELRLKLRFFRNRLRRKEASKALSRLRTIAKILMRELERAFDDGDNSCGKDFAFYRRVLDQKKGDKSKIYSLHEPHVYCMAKGKEHKRYEYGTKVSLATTSKSNVIVAVVNHEVNIHDSKTTENVLVEAQKVRTKEPDFVSLDRGYRGSKKVIGKTQIIIPSVPKATDSEKQKNKKRALCRRRSAIEPIIGHLKSDHRLSRNFLKGKIGDHINLFMSAAAWNFKKWINAFICPFFIKLFYQIKKTLNKIIPILNVAKYKKIKIA